MVDDSSGKYRSVIQVMRTDREISKIHAVLCLHSFFLPMHGEHRHLREHVKLGAGQRYCRVISNEWNDGRIFRATNFRVVDHIDTLVESIEMALQEIWCPRWNYSGSHQACCQRTNYCEYYF